MEVMVSNPYDFFMKSLHEGEVEFEYKKLNGEIRKARGTLNFDMIPTELHPKANVDPKINEYVVHYYDLDKNGWRCFIRDSLISVTASQ